MSYYGACLAAGLVLGYALERLHWRRISRKLGSFEVRLNDPRYNEADVEAVTAAIQKALSRQRTPDPT